MAAARLLGEAAWQLGSPGTQSWESQRPLCRPRVLISLFHLRSHLDFVLQSDFLLLAAHKAVVPLLVVRLAFR